MGLVAAADKSGLEIVYGSYPITPASDILHTLSRYKHHGIATVHVAEDEIAAVGVAIGASFGGALGITGTSGPGIALKGEAMGSRYDHGDASRDRECAARRPLYWFAYKKRSSPI